ncbi:MAG: glycosyltransferase [Bacteroidales bacterium]|nr:glycosyltransferase [Bacteroidales bacterium]MCF8391523.1 glycosyltransferase [Bacteroidales bacterium]
MEALINRDIIITGLQAWDIEIGSNCKNIALQFAKHNRVLYVNSPLDLISALKDSKNPKVQLRKKVIKRKADDLVKISENLWNLNPRLKSLPVSQLKNKVLFDIINKYNNKKFAKQIKSAADRLGFKDYIIFNDSDMFRSFYLKEILKPACYTYYTRDNLLAVKYWQKQGKRIEPLHMAKSDLVISNSTYLSKQAAKYNEESHFVGQGCDISAFNPENIKKVPADIAEIPYPVIGYIGALKSLRLDLNIIEHIALTRKDWNIVLVGPEDDIFKSSRLHELNNVHFLGPKAEAELPSYLNAFDVAINPQLLNEVTIGNYPRKIDEYLAMGKPTIATSTEAMTYFSDFVSLPKLKTEWINAIEQELKNDNKTLGLARQKFASEHSWENNAKEIYKQIEKILSREYQRNN